MIGVESNMLGVREPPHRLADVSVDSSDTVGPDGKGLSVSPDLSSMPPFLVPERLRNVRRGARGNNALRVFRLGDGAFARAPVGVDLELWPDSEKHGVLQPSRRMALRHFQQALGETQSSWAVEE